MSDITGAKYSCTIDDKTVTIEPNQFNWTDSSNNKIPDNGEVTLTANKDSYVSGDELACFKNMVQASLPAKTEQTQVKQESAATPVRTNTLWTRTDRRPDEIPPP